MCDWAPKLYTNNKFSNLEPEVKKIILIYILMVILFFAQTKVNVAAILYFFHFKLLVNNVYFGSTKLPQLNHIIVNMCSGILTVT